MSKKIKKFILPGATLLISSYISALFTVGIIFGYLATNFFQKKLVETNKIGLIIFNLGKWKIHLHHWILGSLMILFIYLINLLFTLPVICLGLLGGLIFHDVYTDKEWYKVIYKN